MGRGIPKMEKIKQEKSRITTYHRRKKCLLNKAWEFSTLCGVDTCIIINGPDKHEPEIWPKDPEKVQNIINKYKETSAGNFRKTFQLHDFFLARKKKVENEIAQVRKEIREAKYPSWNNILNYYQEHELRIITSQLDAKIEHARSLINEKTALLPSNIEQDCCSFLNQNTTQTQNQLFLYNQLAQQQEQQQYGAYPVRHPYYPLNQNVMENNSMVMYGGGGDMSNGIQYPSLTKGQIQYNPYRFQQNVTCESETLPFPSYYNSGPIHVLPDMSYAPQMFGNPQMNVFQNLLNKNNATK